MSRLIVASSIAYVLATGCSEYAGAPRLALQYDPSVPSKFDEVLLSWTHPTGEATGGYAIEVREISEPFKVVQSVDFTQQSLRYVFDPGTPEISDYEFRVRALPEGGELRASSAIRIHRGVRQPLVECSTCVSSANGGFQLEWTNPSTVAEAFVLERTVIRFPGYRHELPSVQLQVPATSYLDTDISSWEDGAGIEYRLTAINGAERSASSTLVSPVAPPFSPTSVTAVLLPSVIRISYQNQSRVVGTIQIWRSIGRSSNLVARVAAPPVGSFGVFDDSISPFLASLPGIYEYSVIAGEEQFQSAPAKAALLYLPNSPFGVSKELKRLPPGRVASRSPSGWATAGGLQTAYVGAEAGNPAPIPRFLVAPGDDASAAFLPGTGAFALRPGLVLDSEGHPHSVYAEPVPGTNSTAIVHAWHDGLVWQREEIARRAFVPRARVDIGLDGTLHASWNSQSALETAKRVDGAWQIEDVAAALGSTLQLQGGVANHFLAGDESGNAHLFVTDGPGGTIGHGYYLFRDGLGWHAESRQEFFDNVDDEIRLVCGLGRVVLAFRSSSFDGPTVTVAERTAQGWTPDVTLGGFGGSLFSNRDVKFEAARSMDGQLIAIAARTSNPEQAGALWVRSNNWTKVASWYDVGFDFALGFRPDGKVWLVSGLQDVSPATGSVPTVLYEQL